MLTKNAIQVLAKSESAAKPNSKCSFYSQSIINAMGPEKVQTFIISMYEYLGKSVLNLFVLASKWK